MAFWQNLWLLNIIISISICNVRLQHPDFWGIRPVGYNLLTLLFSEACDCPCFSFFTLSSGFTTIVIKQELPGAVWFGINSHTRPQQSKLKNGVTYAPLPAQQAETTQVYSTFWEIRIREIRVKISPTGQLQESGQGSFLCLNPFTRQAAWSNSLPTHQSLFYCSSL